MMEALPYREFSCKACYYSSSQLLEFLNHVQKVHYELHTSKTDLPHKGEKEFVSKTGTSSVHSGALISQSGPGVPVEADNSVTCTGNAACEDAKGLTNHNIDTSDQVDQVNVKQETIECEDFGGIHNDMNSEENIQNTAQSPNESSCVKTEITESLSSNEVSAKAASMTASKSDTSLPTPFRGGKINDIADTLKVGYTVDTKPVIDRNTGSVVCANSKSPLTQYSASTETLIADSCDPSHGFSMPSNPNRNPTYFLPRTNSVGLPASVHQNTNRSRSTGACTESIFQPFTNPTDKEGFPNYLSRYASNDSNIHPQHRLSFHTSDRSFSQGSSLFDSTGGFLPGFHALMCAGFVTMPRTQVLQSIKCDEKKWEYIQLTLHNAFRKFPYLNAPEVQVLANLTELTGQQVKTLFAVARLQHGISWDQEEIQNARNYLRIPVNRFCGEG